MVLWSEDHNTSSLADLNCFIEDSLHPEIFIGWDTDFIIEFGVISEGIESFTIAFDFLNINNNSQALKYSKL